MQQDRIYSLKELMEMNKKHPLPVGLCSVCQIPTKRKIRNEFHEMVYCCGKDECCEFLHRDYMIENASRQKEED
jgi:hypothetical protein